MNDFIRKTGARPNSEPTIFFPSMMAAAAPQLWGWAKDAALYYEPSFTRMGWDVWLPLGDNQQ